MSNNPFPNVRRVDFVKSYGNWSEELTAIYNCKKISAEEVDKFIYSGDHYHPDIIITSPQQWESVFSKE